MTDSNALAALEKRVAELGRQVARLEDIHAVKCLHYKYGYYIDKCLYEEAAALFADTGEVRFLNGVYRGRAGIHRLYCNWFRKYFTGGVNGPLRGLLLDHLMLQDVIDVADDGLTAKGRFRCVLQAGCHESMQKPIPNFPRQFWEAGIYENTYVKEGGDWKIRCLDYNMFWRADYHQGWANSVVHLTPMMRAYPEDPNGPDEILSEAPKTWPETAVVPFHYPHPVTGDRWGEP